MNLDRLAIRYVATIGRTTSMIWFAILLSGSHALGQADEPSMPPSEAYKDAMAPFNEARMQADDLTDADRFALGIGINRAARHCLSLSTDLHAFDATTKELLALGELCILGQQFAPAQSALVTYLALPQPPERKLALVLLIRALLGLGEPDGADLQVDSLLRDYPYDAQTHFAIDQVIDAQEAAAAHLPHALAQAQKDCAAQNKETLPLLENGNGIEGKEMSASPSAIFMDAVRCAALARDLGDKSGENAIQRLNTIVQQATWSGRADLPLMQAALARQQMVGTKCPVTTLRGHGLQNGSLIPRMVPLANGSVVLVAVSVWAPGSLGVLRDLAQKLPNTPIYAITSWSANSGSHDAPSDSVFSALRAFQQSSPKHVALLIVPQPVMENFHVDSFPVGFVIRDGKVVFSGNLSGPGSEQMLLRPLDHTR